VVLRRMEIEEEGRGEGKGEGSRLVGWEEIDRCGGGIVGAGEF
jgi:hypothetical protein